MSLTAGEFDRGLRFWRSTSWDSDLHLSFYRQKTPSLKPTDGVFDLQWWNRVWPVLVLWKATRRGGGRDAMTARAETVFPALTRQWSTSVVPILAHDFLDVDWEQIGGFARAIGDIKNVKSPVFTSKLCHFLVPTVFPVVDHRAMANPFPTYEAYFSAARDEWAGTSADVLQALQNRLAGELGVPTPPEYPAKCKIVELCLIGRRQG